ncbi:MAG: tetratricopeptide repeat protein, partial [Opitutales bacterium]|nr:tetratricopeptide repeat protein [Opitutales bacterium]
MKIFSFKTAALTAALFAANTLCAELVWTKDAGWRIEGGVLSGIFGENLSVETALQAMNEAKKFQDEGDNFGAINLYKKISADYAKSIFAPEALYQLGALYAEEGMFEDSFESLQKIIRDYPDYPRFNLVIGQQYKLAARIQAGQTPYLWGWMPWFTDYNLAIKIYEKVVSNAPYSDYAPLALMNIALIAEDLDKPEVAVDALDRIINTYPQNILTPDAYMQMAYTYRKIVEGPEYDQASVMKAIDYYQDFLILFPEDSNTPMAEVGLELMQDVNARSRMCMGDFYYYYRNNMRAASIFYNETITAAPDSLAAKEAASQLKKIADGELPPMTPADWFLGRPVPPTDDQYKDFEQIQKIDAEKFQAKTVEDFIESGVPVGGDISETFTGGAEQNAAKEDAEKADSKKAGLKPATPAEAPANAAEPAAKAVSPDGVQPASAKDVSS